MPARVAKTSKPIRDGSRLIATVSLAGGAPINTSRVRKDPKGPKASSARGTRSRQGGRPVPHRPVSWARRVREPQLDRARIGKIVDTIP
jgi:hypothetical protein